MHVERKLIRRWPVGRDWVRWARHTLEPTSHSPSLGECCGLEGICRVSTVPWAGGVPQPGLWGSGQNRLSDIPRGPEVRGIGLPPLWFRGASPENTAAKSPQLTSSFVERLPPGGQCVSYLLTSQTVA
uniref:Uncharacterized protein n=1 Tax=Myotis myotis TaxID=51298 RepID=A0A7J7YDH9_MYOMY|nr:hypothetical protein mMyoMyo1_010955 [Myotis myotis]